MRLHKVMEDLRKQGKGKYMSPYKKGKEVKKNKKKIINNTTTAKQLAYMAKSVKNFRRIFMRNKLPKSSLVNESAIVNLDSFEGPGTHWVAYKKVGNYITYFDSFGNLKPPLELIEYWGKNKIISIIEILIKRSTIQTVVIGV